jgi:hypothetical protein
LAELLTEVITVLVCVRYPWDPGTVNDLPPIVGRGIPPHVAILQELSCTMGEVLNRFIADFSQMVHEILDERAIEVGGMSAVALSTAIQDGTREIQENLVQLSDCAGLPVGAAARPSRWPSCPTTTGQAQVARGGTFHVIPQAWHFPSCTPLQLWIQWLLGDTVNGVLPLKMLDGQMLLILMLYQFLQDPDAGRMRNVVK